MIIETEQPQAATETATHCSHCHQPIEFDGEDSWRHLSGFYSCMEAGSWNQATPESANL
jgi:NADPH-dependent glutamate synthase beta subunit-like oxidoreductase